MGMGNNIKTWEDELKRRKNISKSTKGRIPWNKGKRGLQTAWNKGLTKEDPRVRRNVDNMLRTRKQKDNFKHKEETKRKIKQSVKQIIKEGKGNPFKLGKMNIAWNGGTSYEPYGQKFNKHLKLQIRTRDNFTCQECHFTEEELEYKLSIHHIDYNKKNNSPNNLISLCKSCHSQTNFNRNDWKIYFQEKIL